MKVGHDDGRNLRMELGSAEERLGLSAPQALSHVKAAAALAEQTLRSVRGLARGLRPSMLDELGLAPALNWLAREYSKHTGIHVNLNIDGSVDHLPEDYRICIYRVVQEALTNCARHARAKEVRLDLQRVGNALSLTNLKMTARGLIRGTEAKESDYWE